MAKYSVQDSADTQRSRIRMPSFVDEPVGPTRPATYLRAAAPSSFTAASRMAAPASFGATSRYADDTTDGEDFADLDVVIPTSIRKNIADGIPRMIFLSELTPAKCAAAERERDVDTTVREFVINEKGHVATRQAHTENAAGESSISPADFIIAGDTLGRAIKTYFPNKQQGRRIAAQLDTHLRSMRAEPDFTTHFPRYRYYHNYVFRSFIQGKTEDMSVINPRLWAKALECHHDETITAGLQANAAASSRHSFRNNSPSRKQAPAARQQQRQPRADDQQQSNGQMAKCIWCAERHGGGKCNAASAKWGIRSTRGGFCPPVKGIRPCFRYNNGAGCPHGDTCRFQHFCTLCGAGAPGYASEAHDAQSCTAA
ncbi:hypothetical protein FB451DRAFT_694982 [Mycena latifolia]|nr:hypothetical protein FB451DRAFT_694982 [Mycena latifolia]